MGVRRPIALAMIAMVAACGRFGFGDGATDIDANGAADADGADTVSAAWWSPEFDARVQLTISPPAASLDRFPLLVEISDADLGGAASDGRDLRFVQGDTLLAHELVALDVAAGSLTAWVLIPSLAADSASEVALYFANPAASAVGDTAAVWDDHVAVWHLDDDPAAPIGDATGAGSTGTAVGGMTAANLVDGVVGRALDFDGIDDGITVAAGAALARLAPMTISVWVKNRAFAENEGLIVARATTYGSTNHDFYVRASDACLNAGIYDGSVGVNTGCVDWSDAGVWHHLALVITDDEARLYFDGALAVISPSPSPRASHPVRIGYWGVADATRSWSGAIDEVWIAPVARSAEWIAMQHASQRASAVVAGPVERRS
jgi:hypothetical protein